MQDSDEDQINMLDSVYPQRPGQIVQRIGDPNQAIYHDRVHSEVAGLQGIPFISQIPDAMERRLPLIEYCQTG